MCRVIFVTTSNRLYKQARDINAWAAKHLGHFDKVIVYDNDNVIDKNFYKQNKDILHVKKGAGLWLWKPYVINKALTEECAEGDVLFYLDAAAFFLRNVRNITKVMDSDIFCSDLPYLEREFTKKELLEYMDMCNPEFTDSRQMQASFMAFRKTPKTVTFVKEWLDLCCKYNLIAPVTDKSTQCKGFYEHRYDQSAFSILCKKYKIAPHSDPTQYSILRYPVMEGVTMAYRDIQKQEYPMCIFLHRGKHILHIINKIRIDLLTYIRNR